MITREFLILTATAVRINRRLKRCRANYVYLDADCALMTAGDDLNLAVMDAHLSHDVTHLQRALLRAALVIQRETALALLDADYARRGGAS